MSCRILNAETITRLGATFAKTMGMDPLVMGRAFSLQLMGYNVAAYTDRYKDENFDDLFMIETSEVITLFQREEKPAPFEDMVQAIVSARCLEYQLTEIRGYLTHPARRMVDAMLTAFIRTHYPARNASPELDKVLNQSPKGSENAVWG